MKYKVGSIIRCTENNSSRYNSIGVIYFADERADSRKGTVRYRVNWFINPVGYIRAEPDMAEYKSDWLETHSEFWDSCIAGAVTSDEKRGRYLCMVDGAVAPPKIEHTTQHEARAEAERLSKLYGGTVRVLQVVASVKHRKTIQYTPVWDEE